MEDEQCLLTNSELRMIFEKIKKRDQKQKEILDNCKKRMKVLQEKINVLNFMLNRSEDLGTGIVEGQNSSQNSENNVEKEESKMKKIEVELDQAELSSAIYWPPSTEYDVEELLNFVLNSSSDDHETEIVEGQNSSQNSESNVEKEESKMKKIEVALDQAELSSAIYWPPSTEYDVEELLNFVLNSSSDDHETEIVEGQNSSESSQNKMVEGKEKSLKMKKTLVPNETYTESLKKREIELKEYEVDLQRKHDRMKKEMEAEEIQLKEKQQQLEAERIQHLKKLSQNSFEKDAFGSASLNGMK